MEFSNISHFKTVCVGGAFTVLTDRDNKSLVWGANTNGEMGLGDT